MFTSAFSVFGGGIEEDSNSRNSTFKLKFQLYLEPENKPSAKSVTIDDIEFLSADDAYLKADFLNHMLNCSMPVGKLKSFLSNISLSMETIEAIARIRTTMTSDLLCKLASPVPFKEGITYLLEPTLPFEGLIKLLNAELMKSKEVKARAVERVDDELNQSTLSKKDLLLRDKQFYNLITSPTIVIRFEHCENGMRIEPYSYLLEPKTYRETYHSLNSQILENPSLLARHKFWFESLAIGFYESVSVTDDLSEFKKNWLYIYGEGIKNKICRHYQESYKSYLRSLLQGSDGPMLGNNQIAATVKRCEKRQKMKE